VKIERIYDRKDLIDITTHTVLHNMVVGIILIVLLQWVFLGDLRSALIVGATIPFALFFAVIILVLRGESANLLSVGAIDFGLIVDATVIMVEAIFRRLTQTTALSAAEQSHISFDTTMGMKSHAILSAAADVSRSIFFAAAIIIAAFLPLFTLSGVEGNIFGPMARTYAYALAGRVAGDLHDHAGAERDHPALAYGPCRNLDREEARSSLRAGVELGACEPQARDGRRRRPRASDHHAGAAVGTRVPAQAGRGQFVDPRHAAADHLAAGGQRLRQRDAQDHPGRPEVESVVSQHGRPTTAPTPPASSTPNSSRPEAQQRMARHPRQGRTDRGIAGQLQDKFPGVEFNFSQYLQDNVSEAVSGVKGENSIKLYGNDLQALTDTANKIKSVLGTVQGVTDLAVFTSLGQPTSPDRYRPGACGALRPVARRYQRHHQGRGRRRQRRRSL
jgi:cobalt-zinc-cadmium resistance protein CzcA